jgi:ATP-dependent Clp protease adaptor protein ClpS
MGEKNGELQGSTLTEDVIETKEPPRYKVLLHNDDYTTMEFVVSILQNIFHRSKQDATKIMLNVHNDGVGIAGVYSREICETKIAIVHELGKKNEYPLRCTMEKE